MSSNISFLDVGESEVDVAQRGYMQAVIVYRNDPADVENLTAGEVTQAYAEFAMSDAHRICFASDGSAMKPPAAMAPGTRALTRIPKRPKVFASSLTSIASAALQYKVN